MSFDIRRPRQLRAVISGLLGTAAFAAAVPPLHAQTTPTLETVTVTAQRRETDLQTTPVAITTERLRLSLAGSYVDATYENFLETARDPTTQQQIDSSGNRLQRTPETQLTGGVDLTLPLGQFGDALNFRVNYTWQGDMFWATDNIAKEDAYGLLDVRVALSPPSSPWAVALWGKNVTDELYRVNIISFFGEEVSQFAAPRTYGADFSWKF